MNTNFQLQSFAFNPALAKTAAKTQTETPVVNNEVKSTPLPTTETFTPTTPLKTPRPGSDMAEMLENMEANGLLPKAETSTPQIVEEKKPQLREPNSEYMQMMVDSVQADKTLGSSSVHVAVNNNGTIALLDDSQFFPGLNSSNETGKKEETQKTGHGHDEVHGHGGHGHGHGFRDDALMGGHLGTEVVEKVGHAAHHAAGHGAHHVATEASNHAVSHAATEAVGHAATEKAAVLGDHMATIAHHGTETAAEAVDMSNAGLHIGKETAAHLSTAMETALVAGSVGAGILAVPITINGIKELKAGIKENDTDKKLEGVGGIAVGLRSGTTAAVMGGMVSGAEALTAVAGAASMGLGVVHAGIDTVLGVRDLKKGKTTEGLIKIGTGVAVGAAACFGGIPLAVATIAMLGVKVGHKIYSHKQEKKAAEAAAQQQPPVVDTANNGAVQTVTPTTQAQVTNSQVKT